MWGNDGIINHLVPLLPLLQKNNHLRKNVLQNSNTKIELYWEGGGGDYTNVTPAWVRNAWNSCWPDGRPVMADITKLGYFPGVPAQRVASDLAMKSASLSMPMGRADSFIRQDRTGGGARTTGRPTGRGCVVIGPSGNQAHDKNHLVRTISSRQTRSARQQNFALFRDTVLL